MAMPAVVARPKKPFREATRERFVQLPSVEFKEGQKININLDQVGLLNWIIVRIRGHVRRASTDTGVVSTLYSNIVNRFRLALNLGASDICNISGLSLSRFNAYQERGMAEHGRLLGSNSYAGHYALPAAPPSSGTAVTPFMLEWMIPVAVNNGRNFEIGLVNLQAAEVRATLEIECGKIADFFVAGSTLTGTYFSDASGTAANPRLEFELCLYQMPNPQVAELPPSMLHRIIEDRQEITALGEQTYRLIKQGFLLQLMHLHVLNGAIETGITNAADSGDYIDARRIVLNANTRLYEIDRFSAWFLERIRYARPGMPGVFMWDFYHGDQRVSHGDVRNGIDTQAIAELWSTYTVAATATLGSGNNYTLTTRRIVQPAL